MLATLITPRVCWANENLENHKSDTLFATDLSRTSTDMVWENLKEQFEQLQTEQLGAEERDMPRSFAGLYIFVSTSMPRTLLESYLLEASKYGGVLVFNGLPKGSFKEFAKLVTELTKDETLADNASLQIDDEAFARFGVKSVPAIVLVKESEYNPSQTSITVYDKILGNVGTRFALEKFSVEGELREEADAYLSTRGK